MITSDSTIKEISSQVPNFYTLICEALGRHIPESMLKMLGSQTIEVASKRVGWDRAKLDGFIKVLNERAQ